MEHKRPAHYAPSKKDLARHGVAFTPVPEHADFEAHLIIETARENRGKIMQMLNEQVQALGCNGRKNEPATPAPGSLTRFKAAMGFREKRKEEPTAAAPETARAAREPYMEKTHRALDAMERKPGVGTGELARIVLEDAGEKPRRRRRRILRRKPHPEERTQGGRSESSPATARDRVAMTRITVLRLGHRKDRDKRASMHVALVARALGAKKIVFCGENDPDIVARVNAVSKKWGGTFSASYSESYRKTIKAFRGKKVHLTMYGTPLLAATPALAGKNLLIVVGSEKVPRDVYELCDANVSATSQPHSEIAALALFMREVQGKTAYEHAFPKARVRIFPSEKGKNLSKV